MAAGSYIVVTNRVFEEDGQFVAVCDELDVSTCADSVEEAFVALRDAVAVYLATLEDENELEQVFREKGIRVHQGQPPRMATESTEERQVKVRVNEYVTPHAFLLSGAA